MDMFPILIVKGEAGDRIEFELSGDQKGTADSSGVAFNFIS
jgi:hypothetical protein